MLHRPLWLLIIAWIASPALGQDAASVPDKPKDLVTYKDHVLPILRKHCVNCHNPDKATSDLNVMSYATLISGGASGEAISPGKPDQSLLYRVIAHLDEPNMPPKQPKIPDAELAMVKRWIELGAPDTLAGAAKNSARKVDLDVAAVSIGKPEGPPPMPENLPGLELPTTLRPHPVSWDDGGLQVASLDHALWFHHPSDLADWHLYVQDSPSASGGRGFNRGSVFSRDGRLVASAAQEALIRFRPKPAAPPAA